MGHIVSAEFGPAAGPGPIYPTGDDDGTLTVDYPPDASSIFAGSDLGAAKTMWIGAPAYTGPVLIRGSEIDASNPVAFSSSGSAAFTELQLPPAAAAVGTGHTWRTWPSETRLRAAGCYAWQVDGTSFSYTIVFQVVLRT